jgi:serine/threonine protein kinase/formylglycine-generating enzyme required for sulfatase activity
MRYKLCVMSQSSGAAAEDRGADDLVGTSIGQYRIEAQIGQGGMGVVYRAVHTEIGQLAAVKVLSSRSAQNPRDLRRFINEARAVSRIDHPGLVKIFDYGQIASGVPYILMEYLRGELLKTRIKRLRETKKGMNVAEALRIGRQTAAALSAAHDKGIVHRDLKPSNVMLVADEEARSGERAKLLDFGIARFVAECDDRTAPGVVIGTPTYMSPEQCAGTDDVDGRSDVYSLGVMLYELIGGEPPFQGNFAELLRMHVLQPVRPLWHLAPELADDLAQLIQQMLSKEPSLRPRIGPLIDELKRWEGEALPPGSVISGATDEENLASQTTSTVQPTGGSAITETRPGPNEPTEIGPDAGSETHEMIVTTITRRREEEKATPEPRPEPVSPQGAQITITIEKKAPIDAEALLKLVAPPEDEPKQDAPADAPKGDAPAGESPVPKAPSAPPRAEDLPRSRRRLLYGLGLVAALTGLIAIWLYQGRSTSVSVPRASLGGMIALPGGTFRMGSTAAEIEAECQRLGSECQLDALQREQPARSVTLSPFYLDAHETTNAKFAKWLNTMTSSLDVKEDEDSHIERFVHDRESNRRLVDLHPEYSGLIHTSEGRFKVRKGYEDKPVVQTTWDGASLYCRWQGKRLPTEAEWEFAARGLSSRRFPWGDEPPRCDSVAFGRSEGGPQCKGWPLGVQEIATSTQDRTPDGIWDLGGNANEWVQDQLLSPSYPSCGACVDPKEERSMPVEEDVRIQRGGAWSTLDAMCRGARRDPLKRGDVTTGAGFRCASQ